MQLGKRSIGGKLFMGFGAILIVAVMLFSASLVAIWHEQDTSDTYLKAIATTGTGTTVDLTGQSANVAGKTIAAALWKSSNENVATVIEGTGEVTAVSAGTTAITAIASNPDKTVVTGIALVTVTATGGPGGTSTTLTAAP